MIFYCGGAREFLFFLPDFRNIFSRWLRFRFFLCLTTTSTRGYRKNACRVSVIRVMRSRIHFSPYIFIVRVRVCANTYSGQYEFHHTNAPSSRIRFSFFHRVKHYEPYLPITSHLRKDDCFQIEKNITIVTVPGSRGKFHFFLPTLDLL